MKINTILSDKKPSISFEVFPPKQETGLDDVKAAAGAIAALKPSFMSVTYGAAGSTSKLTIEVASDIKNLHNVPVLPHLTCVASSKEHVTNMLNQIRENNIDNIMALRGDLPKDGIICHDYEHASDLIRDIKAQAPDLCIGGACYPEGHVECTRKSDDILFLKEKVDAGCDFLTTQMFFDNNIFFNYLYKVRTAGIQVPVVAGIMPVTNANQMARIYKLSQAYVPHRFAALLDKFADNPAAMKQAGIIYATDQIIDLFANGINNVHVYTMNKPEVAAKIQSNVSKILGIKG